MLTTPRRRVAESGEMAVVRRVDHIIIRVDEPAYNVFYRLLSETFQLPIPWGITEHAAFKSGGIFAGNVDFEILHVERDPATNHAGPSKNAGDPATQSARLYGIVFETVSDDLSRLRKRDIAYVPAPYTESSSDGTTRTLWTNIFLDNMMGTTRWMKFVFGLKRLVPDALWLSLFGRGSGQNPSGAKFLFNRIYPNGIVFLVKYNPGWRAIDAERRRSIADFSARQGGALGLVRIKEIVVGATNLTTASLRWDNLLRPAEETDFLCWQVGDGPAIRLVEAESDGIQRLVWQVRSLDYAMDILEDLDMLGEIDDDVVTIDPDAIYGLNIHLVED